MTDDDEARALDLSRVERRTDRACGVLLVAAVILWWFLLPGCAAFRAALEPGPDDELRVELPAPVPPVPSGEVQAGEPREPGGWLYEALLVLAATLVGGGAVRVGLKRAVASATLGALHEADDVVRR